MFNDNEKILIFFCCFLIFWMITEIVESIKQKEQIRMNERIMIQVIKQNNAFLKEIKQTKEEK